MFENPRRSRQARNFTTNAPKILDLKSSSEQIFSRKLPLGAPVSDPLLMRVLLHTALGAEVILESYAEVYSNQFTTGNSLF